MKLYKKKSIRRGEIKKNPYKLKKTCPKISQMCSHQENSFCKRSKLTSEAITRISLIFNSIETTLGQDQFLSKMMRVKNGFRKKKNLHFNFM